MALSTILIGFDIRMLSKPFVQNRWSKEYREGYLLRTDVGLPLSVDNSVWPSRFMQSAPRWLPPDLDAARIRVQKSDSTQYFDCFDVWDEYPEMLSRSKPIKDAWDYGLAVAVVVDSEKNGSTPWFSSPDDLPPVSPSTIDPEWGVLGYDVATQGRTSGLMNCGFPPAEKASARKQWGSLINDNGLLPDPAAAIAFQQFANRQVPEHAPFYVYQLFLIWGDLESPLR